MSDASQAVVVRQAEVITQEMQRFMPVMSMAVAIERREMIVSAVNKLMTPDEDYGIIPGTKKNTLLQPGADKLNNLFGLVPRFEVTEKELDWTGEHHGGEPFFYFEIKCKLYRDGHLMGEGDGSANSWESRYRYRKSERVCPQCGVAAILKSKFDDGGWYCYAKKDGCGAKFHADDPAITEQETGNVINPLIHDLVNTIRKMANKRAKIAATLNATSAHEFFTQDTEDLPPEILGAERKQQPKNEAKKASEPQAETSTEEQGGSRVNAPKELLEIYEKCKGREFLGILADFREHITKLTGSADDYRAILKRNGVKEQRDMLKTSVKQREKIAQDLYYSLDVIKKSAALGVSSADIPQAAAGQTNDPLIDDLVNTLHANRKNEDLSDANESYDEGDDPDWNAVDGEVR